MLEDRKRQSKEWILVDTGDIDAEEHTRSIDNRISKVNFFLGKQMCFCTHHNMLNCKHTCHMRFNEIGVKVLEESGGHDHGAMLEDCKHGIPIHVNERTNETLESNEKVTPNNLHTKRK